MASPWSTHSDGRTANRGPRRATDEPEITGATVWKEYGFKGKPGDERRLPPQVAPYHQRLDWLMWFAALSPAYAAPWLPAFVVALLGGNRAVLRAAAPQPVPPRATRLRPGAPLPLPVHHLAPAALDGRLVGPHPHR